MRFDVITLFPEFLAQSAGLGVVGARGRRGCSACMAGTP